jgi:hypothetical protein
LTGDGVDGRDSPKLGVCAIAPVGQRLNLGHKLLSLGQGWLAVVGKFVLIQEHISLRAYQACSRHNWIRPSFSS